MSMRESVMEAAKRVDAVGTGGQQFGEDIPHLPSRPKAPVPNLAKIERELFDTERKANARRDAHWVIGRAIARGERDASHPNGADTDAMYEIAEILERVQGTV